MQTGSHAQLIFLLLLLVVVIFAAIAQRIRVPYPIVLVVAGLIVSFVQHVPAIELEPDAIFYVLLPLLLYWAAWLTSWRELRRNITSIGALAVGLVAISVLVPYAADYAGEVVHASGVLAVVACGLYGSRVTDEFGRRAFDWTPRRCGTRWRSS